MALFLSDVHVRSFCSSYEAWPSCCSSEECHLIIESLIPLPPCHNYSLCTFLIAYLSTDQIRVEGVGCFGETGLLEGPLCHVSSLTQMRGFGGWDSLLSGEVSGYALPVLVFSSAGCSGVLWSEWARGSLGNWFPDKSIIALYSWSPGKKEDGHPVQKQLSWTEGNVCIKQWRSMRTRSKVSFRASGVPWIFDLLWLLSFCSHLHALSLLWPPLAFWLLLCTPLLLLFFVYCLLCTVNRRGSVLYLPCVESAWPQNMNCLFHRVEGVKVCWRVGQRVRKSKFSMPFLWVLSLSATGMRWRQSKGLCSIAGCALALLLLWDVGTFSGLHRSST